MVLTVRLLLYSKTVFKDLYKKAKHHVTNVVLKAKKLYYNSKISSANCSKELYKITNNILARTKQVHLPTTYHLSSLPELFSNYFSDKIMKIRNELDSQAVSALPAQADSFSGITLSTFEPVTEAMGSFRVNSTNFDKSSQVSVSNNAQKFPKITLVSIMKACQILGGNSEYFWRYSLSNFLFCFAFLPSRL